MHFARPIVFPLFCALALVATARAQIVERLDASGPGVFGDVAAGRCVISDDGRFAAFLSVASNLILPDDTVSVDVYLRDRVTLSTTRIAQNVAQSDRLEISGDGSTVVYGVAHVGAPQFFHTTFAYDRMSGVTTQLGAQLFDTLPGALSPEGHFMVLYARSPALPGIPWQAYRITLANGAVDLASRDMQGMPSRAEPERGGISSDGDLVVFASDGSNLVAGDTNGVKDVFLFQVSTGTVTRLSIDDVGAQGDQDSIAPSMSGNGAIVAFQTTSAVFDPTDVNGFSDIYVRDLNFGTTRRLTRTAIGDNLDDDSMAPIVTADGSKIAFQSLASNLIAGDGTGTYDIFVADLVAEIIRKVTPGSTISGQESVLGNITNDGHFVALQSTILSLPHAVATGGAYLADFGPGCSSLVYCPATINSTGMAGKLRSSGDASRQLNNFVLSVVNLPPNTIAMLVSGTTRVDPGTPFGNGSLCIGGTLIRRARLQAVLGAVIDYQDLSSPGYSTVQPGNVLYYQCVFRDPSAGGAGFNTSNALAVTFCY